MNRPKFLLGMLFAFGPIGLPVSGWAADITITGSSTLAPIVNEIARRYEETRRHARVDVQSGGSSRGIADVRSGIADMGMVSRGAESGESDLIWSLLAMDGLAVIVNEANPVTDISRRQLADVYTGRAMNWEDLGGDEGQIVSIGKAEGRATLDVFLDFTGLQPSQLVPSVIAGENEEVTKAVAGNRNAVGYVSIAAAISNAQFGLPIRPLTIDGVPATLQEVASRRLPMIRELNLVTRPDPDPDLLDFLHFATSAAVSDILASYHVVPVLRAMP